jgi:hypothetical protein
MKQTSSWMWVGCIVLGGALAGCGPESPEEQVCNDFVDAAAEAGERCGADYDEAREAVLASMGGDCGAVTTVRTRDTIYDVCIPWVGQVSCAELAQGTAQIPDECNGQFLVAP